MKALWVGTATMARPIEPGRGLASTGDSVAAAEVAAATVKTRAVLADVARDPKRRQMFLAHWPVCLAGGRGCNIFNYLTSFLHDFCLCLALAGLRC